MPDLIVFRLEAPMAAFGELAVGERRGSARRPTHSAIAGLIASALGFERAHPGLEALAAGFRLAVRTDRIGAPLADFHTAQTPPQRKNRHYATRKAELAIKTDLGTIVSRRDYWTDVAFTILLWPNADLSPSPAALVEALTRPAFPPFAGRRSCPLGAPVAARLIAAADVAEAFAAYDRWQTALRRAAGLPADLAGTEIAVDATLWDEGGLGPIPHHRVHRRDRLTSRARWQFDLREEVLVHLPASSAAPRPDGGDAQ